MGGTIYTSDKASAAAVNVRKKVIKPHNSRCESLTAVEHFLFSDADNFQNEKLLENFNIRIWQWHGPTDL